MSRGPLVRRRLGEVLFLFFFALVDSKRSKVEGEPGDPILLIVLSRERMQRREIENRVSGTE
jgi:hypothetical protein